MVFAMLFYLHQFFFLFLMQFYFFELFFFEEAELDLAVNSLAVFDQYNAEVY